MDKRLAVASLVLSAAGLVYIAEREGYSDRAYPDPVHGKAVPTVGFGATKGVRPGDVTSPVRALVRLRVDAAEHEVALRRCLNVPLLQREWDAYVALAYNAGASNVCLNNARTGPSTIARRLHAGDYSGACDAILLYDRAGAVNRPEDRCSHPANRSCRGVWVDRQRLRGMCLGQEAP